jgi:hypothetical protein
MATSEKVELPAYGDVVRLHTNIGHPFARYSGMRGSVCGFWEVLTTDAAQETGASIGEVLCMVEFPDGNTLSLRRSYFDIEENGD